MKLTLGCDPEVFVTRDNIFHSAIDTIGGSKEFPRPLMDLGENFCVQEDNVALEFNIPPSASSEAWSTNIARVLRYLSDKMRDEYNLVFSTQSAGLFAPDQLQDIRALTFGCDPDFNAWTGYQNPMPAADNPNLRSCGGHIHVGTGGMDLTREEKRRFGRLMDLHLGIPSVLMDDGELRKKLYGKAGALRYKEYGLEYRVLSNFWIFEESKRRWAWDATERAARDFEEGHDCQNKGNLITGTINDNNKTMASQIIAEYHLNVC